MKLRVQVKTQGFSRVPIQFRPMETGLFTATLQLVTSSGKLLKSKLIAKAV
jgi:hypothetical protein